MYILHYIDFLKISHVSSWNYLLFPDDVIIISYFSKNVKFFYTFLLSRLLSTISWYIFCWNHTNFYIYFIYWRFFNSVLRFPGPCWDNTGQFFYIHYQLQPHQPPHQPQLYHPLEPELDHRLLHELESVSGKCISNETKLKAHRACDQYTRLSSYSISGISTSIFLLRNYTF